MPRGVRFEMVPRGVIGVGYMVAIAKTTDAIRRHAKAVQPAMDPIRCYFAMVYSTPPLPVVGTRNRNNVALDLRKKRKKVRKEGKGGC